MAQYGHAGKNPLSRQRGKIPLAIEQAYVTELTLEDGAGGIAIDIHLTSEVALALVHVLQAAAVAWIGHQVWRNGRKINEVKTTVENGKNGVAHVDQDIHSPVHPKAAKVGGVRDEARSNDDSEPH